MRLETSRVLAVAADIIIKQNRVVDFNKLSLADTNRHKIRIKLGRNMSVQNENIHRESEMREEDRHQSERREKEVDEAKPAESNRIKRGKGNKITSVQLR